MRFLEGPEKGKLGAGNCIYFFAGKIRFHALGLPTKQ